ncbi:fumarate hydratase [Mucilaginibacter robiniae]|nr:fumarate hydratase [Mucilaginibacter robiniae]
MLYNFRTCFLNFWLLAFAAMCAALSSCHPNASIQEPGQAYLQGEWQQQKEAIHQKLITYSLYHLKFSCDSFYVQMQSFSHVNSGADTCMRSGHWVEYAKGVYYQQNDTLRLKGYFTTANNSLKRQGGCFRSGIYDEVFKVGSKTDSALQLTSTSNVVPIHLQLIKRATCHPKPLQ